MLYYNYKLKQYATNLRNNQTDAEKLLWHYIRGKQIHNIQFFRQKPLGNYIVDFYAPKAKLIIELDGGQHFDVEYLNRDKIRDRYFATLGFEVLRFDNYQVLTSIDIVLELIFCEIEKSKKSP